MKNMKATKSNVQDLFPAIAHYKELLKEYLNRRPSGIRQKLAISLGTHKSFISQITNSHYRVPIPAHHVATIMSICHFSPDERKHFLSAYLAAHPDTHLPIADSIDEGRHVVHIEIPDLGDTDWEREVADAIRETAARMIALAQARK